MYMTNRLLFTDPWLNTLKLQIRVWGKEKVGNLCLIVAEKMAQQSHFRGYRITTPKLWAFACNRYTILQWARVVFNFRKFLLYGVKLLTMGHGSKFKSDVPSHGKIPAYSNGSLIRMDKSALCKFCDLCLVQSNCVQCVASTESASNAIRFVSCVIPTSVYPGCALCADFWQECSFLFE